MMKQQNKLNAEKKFAQKYKIKSLKLKKYCPWNKDSVCYFGEEYYFEKHYNEAGNLVFDSAFPYPYTIFKDLFTYENGKLVKISDDYLYDRGGTTLNTSYKYDASGNISEVEIQDHVQWVSDTWTKKIFSYENGRLLKIQEMEKGSDSLYHPGMFIGFLYDASGKLTEETHTSSTGKMVEKYLYTYDSMGKFLNVDLLTGNKKNSSVIYKYSYNTNGDTTSYTYTIYEKSVTITSVFNDKNQKIEEYNDDQEELYKDIFSYNENGQIMKKNKTRGGKSLNILFTYNDKGLISEKKFFDEKDQWWYSEKYSYEYYE